MNFNTIYKIHNDNFDEKYSENYFESINNIKAVYLIEESAYLILLDSIDVYEIFEIAVLNDKKRQGLATKLLNMLPNDKDIFLEVNENNKAAINLYLKSGFKQISIRKKYYKDADAIIMKRDKDVKE